MNKLNLLLAAIFLASSAAADEVNRSVDAAAAGRVDVSNIAGSVKIIGWSRDQVEVTAELGSDVSELIVRRDGDQVVIKVEVPRRKSRDIESELVIHVPKKSSVKVGTVSADITVQEIFGSQTLNTVSGDIETMAFEADLEIETVSGDVELRGNGSKMNARINTVSGDIEAMQLAGDVTVGTVSGDISVVDGAFDRARMNTTNGDMVFHASLGSGRLSAETINGEINVRLLGKVSARFEVETFNGDIRSCFGPKPVRTSEHMPGTELNFSEGRGEGWVTIKTLNGDVDLCNK